MEKVSLTEKDIEFAIVLKWTSLRYQQLSSLTLDHVRGAIFGLLWQRHEPVSLSEAIKDINSITANEVVAYLAKEAVIVGANMELDEVETILSGYR